VSSDFILTYSVVDHEDRQRLKDSVAVCGIQPDNPNKPHIGEQPRIPQPEALIQRAAGAVSPGQRSKWSAPLQALEAGGLADERVHILWSKEFYRRGGSDCGGGGGAIF